MRSIRGFSLLELLIVIAIIAIIAVVGSDSYRNYVKTVELRTTARTIVADLGQVRSKAMTGDGGYKWGVHFINGTDDYYELFSTDGTYSTTTATTTLSKSITFSSPTEGNTTNIIFNKISGTTTAATVIITSEGATQTVTVNETGAIY